MGMAARSRAGRPHAGLRVGRARDRRGRRHQPLRFGHQHHLAGPVDRLRRRAAAGLRRHRRTRLRHDGDRRDRRWPHLGAGAADQRATRHRRGVARLRHRPAGGLHGARQPVSKRGRVDHGRRLHRRRRERQQRRGRHRRDRRRERGFGCPRRVAGHDARQLLGVRRRQRLRPRRGADAAGRPDAGEPVPGDGRRHVLGAAAERAHRRGRHGGRHQRHGADHRPLQPEHRGGARGATRGRHLQRLGQRRARLDRRRRDAHAAPGRDHDRVRHGRRRRCLPLRERGRAPTPSRRARRA